MTYIDTSDTGQGSQLNKGISYEIGFLCLNEKYWDHAGVIFGVGMTRLRCIVLVLSRFLTS